MPPGTPELITAVSHPLRRRILRAYLDEALQCASASEVARSTNAQVARVAYHLKTLARCEILRPVQREVERGAEPDCGWVLGVEAEWLRLVLDLWAQSDPTG
jgi:DNA-binding transcriptional ArsR family regulator